MFLKFTLRLRIKEECFLRPPLQQPHYTVKHEVLMEYDEDVPIAGQVNHNHIAARMEEDACASSDEEWDDEETEGWLEDVTCLFCPLKFKIIEEALPHCKEQHHFDVAFLKSKHRMDCHCFIKMINYIRTHGSAPNDVMSAPEQSWQDEMYLRPVLQDDPWIMFDFEEFLGELADDSLPTSGDKAQNEIALLRAQLSEKDEMLSSLQERLMGMSNLIQRITSEESVPDKTALERNECSYFESYDKLQIHHEMLSDSIRTKSYKDAIRCNEATFQDKVVMDVGSGTGILSMFAASAGASKVYAVEKSAIIRYTKDIIRENKLDHIIELVRGRVEDELKLEKVDIIISEWMGYFLMYEGMIASVIHARDKYLKTGGIILPNKCQLYIMGADDPQHQYYVDFWDNVYGYKMTCVGRQLLHEASVCWMPPEYVVTDRALLKTLDINTCSFEECYFDSAFTLTANRDTVVTALIGYFDVAFDLEHPVSFSTGPYSTATHWQQTVFYLPNPVKLKAGEKLDGNLKCMMHSENSRGLKVEIQTRDDFSLFVLD